MVTAHEKQALHYEDFGRGPAMVILHDYPSNRELRKTHFEMLAAAGCRVVIINPGGLGRVVPAEAAAVVERQTRRVMALINYLGIGRAVFVSIGRGGRVLLDLMERFPGRVAAGSFVLSPALAADLRHRTGHPELQSALREGRYDDLRNAFRAALNAMDRPPAPGQLHRLRAWVASVGNRVRSTGRPGPREWASLLEALQVPPLLLEADDDASLPQKASRLRPFRALNAHLAALLGMLLPAAELFDEPSEDPDSGAA